MTVDVGIHEVRCENVFDPNNPFIARGSSHPDWARYEIVVPTDDVPPEAVTPPVKVQVLLITPEGEDPRWEVAYGTPGLVDAQIGRAHV